MVPARPPANPSAETLVWRPDEREELTGSGVCWDAVYSKPITNDGANFKAKSD